MKILDINTLTYAKNAKEGTMIEPSPANTLLFGRLTFLAAQALFGLIAISVSLSANAQTAGCEREVTANVVAFDMPLMWNRMGAQNINGMMYALRRDTVTQNDIINANGSLAYAAMTPLSSVADIHMAALAGQVTLRPDKRPRPLVLRMGEGDCMSITLTNLLTPTANPLQPLEHRSNVPFTLALNDQVAGRKVSLHFQGTELVDNISDDGSNVGKNGSSLIDPGASHTYHIRGLHDGAFIGTSFGQTTGGEGLGGQTASGLFAVLNVSARGAGFFRSQVTNEELLMAAGATPEIDLVTGLPTGKLTGAILTPQGHPIMNWQATYPNSQPWISEGKAGLPILNMIQGNEIVHNDLNAIVAYVGVDFETLLDTGEYGYPGHFPKDVYPLESKGKRNPTVPNRLEPFREYTVAFHDEASTKQAFPAWFEDPVLAHTLHGVRDSFMINYGSGGIGSEIIANRLGVGPMHDCVNCAYEEFFLTFSAVGEVGQLTDIPANLGLEQCNPALENCGAVGPKANYILFPDDPSNVHHSYIGDAVAFRNLHAGPGEQHVFHLHNHQWLFNADDDNSNYLDAQGLGPGSGYAYWVNFGGSGNRNKTAGDAIFHCHFYPHFAQGMWEMWRIHDAFEPGTALQTTLDGGGAHVSFVDDGIGQGNGTPAPGARALPDGEVVVGAPTPAVVPLPGKPMAPYPAIVTVKDNPNQIEVCLDSENGLRTPRNSEGVCVSEVTAMQPVGSLSDVDRDSVAGLDGEIGYDIYGKTDDLNPGYPFWIAGMEHTVGNRAPTPPLDMMSHAKAAALQDTDPLWSHPGFAAQAADGINIVDGWDGGLPRFSVEGYAAGGHTAIAVTRLDFTKEIEKAKPVFYPEEGTDLEQVSMRYHAERCHDTYNPDGTLAPCLADRGGFITNGQPPVPGAPFQEPCMDDQGQLMQANTTRNFFGGELGEMWDLDGMTVHGSSPHDAVRPRYFKAANVQFDATFNKLGYHFPQQRIITMWQDVIPTINKERPPEPFVLRMNTFDCAQYVHSNVVPKTYELDDYQVRTPTDIIGQHIHLPKWDLTSADGSANGWNYEDGTLSPGAVVEMIEAINHYNTEAATDGDPNTAPVLTDYRGNPVIDSAGHNLTESGGLEPAAHPYFRDTVYGGGCDTATPGPWCGARSTMQRWFADPVVNVQGVDRGLGIIFTHDHYGPSTHQQVGLYATMLIEPSGSKWVHNETGRTLNLLPDGTSPNNRIDGGPTSWQAAILTGSDGFGAEYGPNSVKSELVESYREFYVEYTDFQHAYQAGTYVGTDDQGFALVDYKTSQGSTCADGSFSLDCNGDGFIDNPIDVGDPQINNQSFRDAIQPPIRLQASEVDGYPLDIWEFPATCPGGVERPCAEAITADDPGLYVVNYRNESLAARIYDPNRADCPDPSGGGCQAAGKQGDLAFAMDSNVHRAIPELNDKRGLAPAGYEGAASCDDGTGRSVSCPPITTLAALSGGDPFTPTMRTYDGDRVHIKIQAGGQEEEHGGTVHGMKWLQSGSGFGEAKNSGWRNSQNGGISEQFALRAPIFADINQRGRQADYAYSLNPSVDGWVNGTWGVIRSYSNNEQDLVDLPGNNSSKSISVTNAKDFNKVCPKIAPQRSYDITAVQANDVLGGNPLVYIQDMFAGAHVGGSPDTDGGTLVYNDRATFIQGALPHEGGTRTPDHVGPLHDPTAMLYVNTDDLLALDAGGYQVRKFKISGKKGKGGFKFEAWYVDADDNYVWHHDMTAADWAGVDDRCYYTGSGGAISYEPFRSDCPVKLRSDAPVEPLVMRANAGDCIDVTLRNKILSPATYTDGNGITYRVYRGTGLGSPAFFADNGYTYTADLNGDGVLDATTEAIAATDISWDQTLDLATGNALPAMVRRKAGMAGEGMTSFNNNLMQPSASVGLHAALVEYDVTRSDGNIVGQNPGDSTAVAGGQTTYQWYAGDISQQINDSGRKRTITLVATPIEFGGFNIMPADTIKQGQKGLIAAGVIYPEGSTWTVDAGSNTSATVTASGVLDVNDTALVTFRDFTTVAQKGASMFYADSYPVENLLGEGSHGVAEDSQDMGQMAINYGNEAMWFRAGVNPTDFDGMTNDSDADELYSNAAAGDVDSDPQTAVFTVAPGDPYRMHVLMPFAPGRGSTFDLHGHVWQRDPYACPGPGDTGEFRVELPGKCDMGNGLAGANGDGQVGSQRLGFNPMGFYLGGLESWFAGQHYDIVLPSAGGESKVAGDYLFRDHQGLGNAGGLWGIVRVKSIEK